LEENEAYIIGENKTMKQKLFEFEKKINQLTSELSQKDQEIM
jgi:ABC-type Fe3+-citrate transport system substrate-binding protein